MKITPLKCEQCGGKINAQSFDVVVCCTNCTTAFEVKPDKLLKRELIYFINTTLRDEVHYLPFWYIPARVNILYSNRPGAEVSGLLNFFGELIGLKSKSQDEINEFIIPSFKTELKDMREIALKYTMEIPRKFSKTNRPVLGSRLSFEDAKRFAEFILISWEVAKPGVLQKFKYKLEFGEPKILGIPFVIAGEFVKDIFQDKYRYNPM